MKSPVELLNKHKEIMEKHARIMEKHRALVERLEPENEQILPANVFPLFRKPQRQALTASTLRAILFEMGRASRKLEDWRITPHSSSSARYSKNVPRVSSEILLRWMDDL